MSYLRKRLPVLESYGTQIQYVISADYSVGSYVLPKISPKGYVAKGDLINNTGGSLRITSPANGQTIELQN